VKEYRKTDYHICAPVRLTIALLTDFHNTEPGPVLASLKAEEPDMICIAGDLLLGYRPENGNRLIVCEQKNVLKLISGCTQIAPTYISLGNHEWMFSEEDAERLEEAGAVVLDNRWVACRRRKTSADTEDRAADLRAQVPGEDEQKMVPPVLVGGLTSADVTDYQRFRRRAGGRYPDREDDPHYVHPDPFAAWLEDFERQEGYKILLCHHPEYWRLREPFLAERAIDLVLSGHAHGGQVRLFGRGIYAPGQGLFPRYTGGVYENRLVVSRGLSNTTIFPRLFNPPEVVFIRLGDRNKAHAEK